MKEKKIGYCGLLCEACLAYIATEKNDTAERKRIAKQWSEEFNKKIDWKDINCVGCASSRGPHIPFCGVCEIRNCAQEKSLKSCAYCAEYPCEKLGEFLAMVPEARLVLEELRMLGK